MLACLPSRLLGTFMRRVFEVLRAIRSGVCGQDEADASMMIVLWAADLLAGAECVE
jgi:hypothetical protein